MQLAWPRYPDAISLSAGALDVWAIPIGERQMPLDESSLNLCQAERERAAQFRLDGPRQRFLVARAALRMLIGRYLSTPASAVEFENDPRGKPRLAGLSGPYGIRFNVAHSGQLVLIAVTTGCEVGIDVEQLRIVNRADQIARRFFHPKETEAVLAAAPPTRDAIFLRCWTGKEAVLKAMGVGVTGPLSSFHVPTDDFGAAWIEVSQREGHVSRCWLRALAPCDGYISAVACLGEERVLRCFAFDWR